MPKATVRGPAEAGLWALVVWLILLGGSPRPARADGPPPTAAIGGPAAPERAALFARGSAAARPSTRTQGSGGWWLGTAGIALALAVFGVVSLASRRYLPQNGSGPLRVVGRTSLSPKHTVYLLKAGDRVLIVGTGPQGAPSLLGELTDPVEMERTEGRTSPPPTPAPAATSPLTVRYDHPRRDDA